MKQLIEINEVILEIYRLANEVPINQFRPSVFKTLNRLIPFNSALWINNLSGNDFLSEDNAFVHNQPGNMLEAFDEFSDDDPTYFAAKNAIGKTVNSSLYVPKVKGKKAQIIDGFTNVFGIEHIICTAIVRNDHATNGIDIFNGLSLYREDPLNEFSQQEMLIKQMLTPHIIEAYKIALLLAFKSSCYEEQDQSRMMGVVDNQGNVLHATETFIQCTFINSITFNERFIFFQKLIGLGEYKKDGFHFKVSRLADGLFFINCKEDLIFERLSKAELRVANLLAEGKTYKEVAERLYISPRTVTNHSHSIYKKLKIRNKTELTWLFKNQA